MKTIPVEALHLSEDLLKTLRDKQETLLITDQGKPLAQVLPYPEPEENPYFFHGCIAKRTSIAVRPSE